MQKSIQVASFAAIGLIGSYYSTVVLMFLSVAMALATGIHPVKIQLALHTVICITCCSIPWLMGNSRWQQDAKWPPVVGFCIGYWMIAPIPMLIIAS